MKIEKDTALIVKELWEAIDVLVEKTKNDDESIKSLLGSESVGLAKSQIIIGLHSKLMKVSEEKEALDYKILENEDKFKKFDELENSNFELLKKLEDLKKENEKYLNDISDLRKIEKDIEYTRQEITRKNKDLNTRISEIERLKEELASKENLIYKLQNSNDSSEINKELIEQYELDKVRLTEENEYLNKKANKYEEELKEQQFTIDEFNKKLISLNDEKFDTARKIDQLKRNYELLNTRNENLDKENEELQAKINELNVYQKLLELKEKEILDLNNSINEWKEKYSSKEDELYTLKNEIKELQKVEESEKSSGLNADELLAEKEYYKDKLKKAEIILAEINRQMNEKEKLIEEMRLGNEGNELVNEEVVRLNNEISVLKDRLAESKISSTFELDGESIGINELGEMVTEYKLKLRELNDNLENMSKVANERLSQIQELQKEKENFGKVVQWKDKEILIRQIDDLIEKLEKFAV